MTNRKTLPGKTKKTDKTRGKAKCFKKIKEGDILYKVEGGMIYEMEVLKIFRFSIKPYAGAEYDEKMLGFYCWLSADMFAMKEMFTKDTSFQNIHTNPETALKALKTELEKREREAFATYKKARDTRTESVNYYLKKYHLEENQTR